MDFIKKTSSSSSPGGTALTGAILATYLEKLNGWTLCEGKRIEKEYKFSNFKKALAFTNQVGEIAEKEGHHPDLFLSYGKVKIQISTHKIDGLSENDFILAAKIDLLEA